MTGPEVRVATADDVARLQRIEDVADQRFVERFRPEVRWPAAPGEQRAAEPGFVLVAAVAGEAVGFVHVLEVDGLAHLEQLSVLPAHGGRRIGRALVDAALAEAATRGHARVTLRTYADVPWNAPFYRRLGFVESEPDRPFLHALVDAEERLGLDAHGRRVQMTASTVRRSAGISHAPDGYRCPFCALVAGDPTGAPARGDVVRETSAAIAIVSPRWWARNPGHLLVLPKRHHEHLYAIGDEDLHAVMDLVRRAAIVLRDADRAEGTSVRQHDEPAGGQDVWHLHVHVFPRWTGDDLYSSVPEPHFAAPEQRAARAERLRAHPAWAV